MINDALKIRAQSAPWMNGIELLMFSGKSIVTDLVLNTPLEGSICEPSARLTMLEAQALMDDLYQAGLRPTQQRNEQQAPIKKHLEDMRAIAFDKLKMEKPK